MTHSDSVPFHSVLEDNRPLPVTSTGLLDGPSVDARLAWRHEMDRQVKRLLQDTNFALDDRLNEEVKHVLRVNHADRMYDWYGKHGMKQARKERQAPSHLRFNQEDPVMPGSLRRRKEVAPALLAPVAVRREFLKEEDRPGSRGISTPKTLLTTAGRSFVKAHVSQGLASSQEAQHKACYARHVEDAHRLVANLTVDALGAPRLLHFMEKSWKSGKRNAWSCHRSRARSAAADVTTAWEKHLGRLSGTAGELKESGVDGEAIGAWLSGATSGAMCGAQVLESTVRGAEATHKMFSKSFQVFSSLLLKSSCRSGSMTRFLDVRSARGHGRARTA